MSNKNRDVESLLEVLLQSIAIEGWEVDNAIEYEALKMAKFVIAQNSTEEEEDTEVEELNFDYDDRDPAHNNPFNFENEDDE